MAFSDVLETIRVVEDDQAEVGSDGSEKRVCLPKPDVNNITVLTESLPNEPILPWHHFDSPWLEKDDAAAEEAAQAESERSETAEDDAVQQLTLALDGVEPAPGAPAPAQDAHLLKDSLLESSP